MIFSNRVIAILSWTIWWIRRESRLPRRARGSHDSRFLLPHDQRAPVAAIFRVQTLAQVFDDVVVQRLASRSPAPGAGELLDARAQSAESQQCWSSVILATDGVAQARKKEQLTALGNFAGQCAQIRFDHTQCRGCLACHHRLRRSP